MLNVTINPLISPMFHKNGYWFDFDCGKTTFRNQENTPLFEIIYDQTTNDNILLTKERVYYTRDIYISCTGRGEPNLYFKTMENDKVESIAININYDGYEEKL